MERKSKTVKRPAYSTYIARKAQKNSVCSLSAARRVYLLMDMNTIICTTYVQTSRSIILIYDMRGGTRACYKVTYGQRLLCMYAYVQYVRLRTVFFAVDAFVARSSFIPPKQLVAPPLAVPCVAQKSSS